MSLFGAPPLKSGKSADRTFGNDSKPSVDFDDLLGNDEPEPPPQPKPAKRSTFDISRLSGNSTKDLEIDMGGGGGGVGVEDDILSSVLSSTNMGRRAATGRRATAAAATTTTNESAPPPDRAPSPLSRFGDAAFHLAASPNPPPAPPPPPPPVASQGSRSSLFADDPLPLPPRPLSSNPPPTAPPSSKPKSAFDWDDPLDLPDGGGGGGSSAAPPPRPTTTTAPTPPNPPVVASSDDEDGEALGGGYVPTRYTPSTSTSSRNLRVGPASAVATAPPPPPPPPPLHLPTSVASRGKALGGDILGGMDDDTKPSSSSTTSTRPTPGSRPPPPPPLPAPTSTTKPAPKPTSAPSNRGGFGMSDDAFASSDEEDDGGRHASLTTTTSRPSTALAPKPTATATTTMMTQGPRPLPLSSTPPSRPLTAPRNLMTSPTPSHTTSSHHPPPQPPSVTLAVSHELLAEIDRLRSNLLELKKENQSLVTVAAEKEVRLNTMEAHRAAKESEIRAMMEAQLASERRRAAQLHDEAEVMAQSEVRKLRRTLDDLREEHARLVETRERELKRQANDVADARADAENALRDATNRHRVELDQLKRQHARDLETMQRQLDVEKQHASEESSRKAQLESLVTSLQNLAQKTKDDLERDLLATRDAIRAREMHVEQHERTLTMRERSVSEREEQVASLKHHLDSILSSVTRSKEDEAEALRIEKVRLGKEQARLEAVAASLEREKDEVKELAAQHQRLLDEAAAMRTTEREALLRQVDLDREALLKERIASAADLEACRRKETEVRRSLAELELKADAMRREVARLERERDEHVRLLRGETDELSTARAAVEKERVRQMEEQARLAARATDVEERAAALSAAIEEFDTVKQMTEHRHRECTKLEREAVMMKRDAEAMQAEMNQQRRHIESERLRLAHERQGVTEERLALSKAAEVARAAGVPPQWGVMTRSGAIGSYAMIDQQQQQQLQSQSPLLLENGSTLMDEAVSASAQSLDRATALLLRARNPNPSTPPPPMAPLGSIANKDPAAKLVTEKQKQKRKQLKALLKNLHHEGDKSGSGLSMSSSRGWTEDVRQARAWLDEQEAMFQRPMPMATALDAQAVRARMPEGVGLPRGVGLGGIHLSENFLHLEKSHDMDNESMRSSSAGLQEGGNLFNLGASRLASPFSSAPPSR